MSASPSSAGAPPTPSEGRTALARTWGLTLLANHYPALHGLRVLGIVSIVQLHLTGAFLRHGLLFPDDRWFLISDGLWFGMDLFFLLSGFLIGSMLLADTAPPGRAPSFGRFYARRALRILPPYYVVLTVLAIAPLLGPEQRRHLAMEYFYLTNYAPPTLEGTVMPWGWSLAVEEHFYLVVPALVAALARLGSARARVLALVALWASAPVLRAWVFAARGPWDYGRMMTTQYVQSHLRYDILVAGVLVALVWREWGPALRRTLARPAARRGLGALSAAALLALALGVPLQLRFLGWNVVCWGTLTSLAYAPLVAMLVAGHGGLARALSGRGFLVAATLGYGIYLVHVPVIEWLVAPFAVWSVVAARLPVGLAWSLSLAFALALSAAGAWVLHVVVERPALALRDRFAR